MFDNMLIPRHSICSSYASGKIVGALIDDPLLPNSLRRRAKWEHAKAFEECDFPLFERDADLSGISGSSKGKLCTPWHYYLRGDRQAMYGAQKTGDCVSWGIRTASDITRVWEISREGQAESYDRRQATCLIYSGRGHTGQGANSGSLSRWHVETGFALESIIVDADGKEWDLRSYGDYVSLGMRYGRRGMPDALIEVTKKHRMRQTSNVRDMDALADALFNGYGAHVGSGIGVSSSGDPISRLRGGWAHNMAIVGFDDTRKHSRSRLFFWDQSWGNWNRISNIPEEWKPWGQGMFALTESDSWKAVRGGGCWIFSDSDGFPGRPFDNLLI